MAAPIHSSLLRRLALLDYPLPLKIHAYLLLGLGTSLAFFPNATVTNPLYVKTVNLLGLPTETTPPTPSDSKEAKIASRTIPASSRRNLTITGLLALGLGLSYVGSAAFVARPEQNQLLYAAVPLRFLMSAAALVTWVKDPKSRSVFSLTVVVEDFLGAVWLTYVMRDWPLWSSVQV